MPATAFYQVSYDGFGTSGTNRDIRRIAFRSRDASAAGLAAALNKARTLASGSYARTAYVSLVVMDGIPPVSRWSDFASFTHGKCLWSAAATSGVATSVHRLTGVTLNAALTTST